MACELRNDDDAVACHRGKKLKRTSRFGDAGIAAMATARQSNDTVAALGLLSALPANAFEHIDDQPRRTTSCWTPSGVDATDSRRPRPITFAEISL
jgi:hypothetical protein